MLPLSLYTKEELEIEHPILKQTVDELSHEKYKDIGIGSHGTLFKYEASIREKIMLTGINNFDGRSQLGEGFYIGNGKGEKEISSLFSEEHSYATYVEKNNNENRPTILKILSPEFQRLKGLVIPMAYHWKSIPWVEQGFYKKYIKKFDYLTSFVEMGNNTFKNQWVQIKFNERAFYLLNVK